MVYEILLQNQNSKMSYVILFSLSDKYYQTFIDFKRVFTMYGHDIHRHHVTVTFNQNCIPAQLMLHVKFDFNWPSG